MSPQTLRLVLLVSCAHALVHVYELVFPSVELLVKADLDVADTSTIGLLASAWAFPFGAGALMAGWLADRYGSVPVLVAYLLGCGMLSGCVGLAPTVQAMLPAMFLMGSFASLYHPAGLAIISRATTPRNRGIALGYHGVLGSAGIAGAPFFAGLMLRWLDWREIYLLLVVPGLLLGAAIAYLLREARVGPSKPSAEPSIDAASRPDEVESQLRLFFLLCVVSAVYGFIYRGFLTFLPRYLSGTNLWGITAGLPQETAINYLAASVLLVGIAGQFLAGHLCGRVNLEKLMLAILLGIVPFLFQMRNAEGPAKLFATGGFALIFFMWQPVSNCLIARYTSLRRRSLSYGLSFFLSFGLGSTGAYFAGWVTDQFGLENLYPVLGCLAIAAAGIAVLIYLLAREPSVDFQ
jgi:MFS family permease